MRNYLSFGGGVNSVAMMLMLLDQGVEFEAVFVNHGTDWPETYEYVDMFQEWLKKHGHKQITVLKPYVRTIDGKIFENLYDYYEYKKVFPMVMSRACTAQFKIRPIYRYVKTPCFMMIGIDKGEEKRAILSVHKGVENRFPLIENGKTRQACKNTIKFFGLPVPMKSGCYICPFQKVQDFKRLRIKHPELFCKATHLEDNYIERRKKEGKPPIHIRNNRRLKYVIEENQMQIFEQDEYPPCQCGL